MWNEILQCVLVSRRKILNSGNILQILGASMPTSINRTMPCCTIASFGPCCKQLIMPRFWCTCVLYWFVCTSMKDYYNICMWMCTAPSYYRLQRFVVGTGVLLLYTMRFRQQMYALQYCISSQLIGAATRPCHQNECPRENTKSKNAHSSDLNYSRRAIWLVFQSNRIVSCKKRNILYFFSQHPA